jgi:hypothetical protein
MANCCAYRARFCLKGVKSMACPELKQIEAGHLKSLQNTAG